MATFATGELVTAAKLNLWTMPPGGVIVWPGTIANIPSGWVICDGNNGTTNYLGRFLEGVATAATNPGATGGATSKTSSNHNHTIGYNANGTTGGAVWTLSDGTTGLSTVTISDIRPLFTDVAWIMKT